MGTRSLVHFKEDRVTLATVYRQYDGYLSGMGADLKAILADGQSQLTNGYSGKQANPAVFNGMGCLAAYVIGELKRGDGERNSIGNVYVQKPGAKDCGEEYTYTIYNKLIRGQQQLFIKALDTWKKKTLYDGALIHFMPVELEKGLEAADKIGSKS